MNEAPLRIAVLCPHFAPDTAPTGEVMTRIVHELVALGHEVHVITSLPWYREHRIEQGWTGTRVRREPTPWGSIIRVDPFPGTDKRNLLRRAAGFVGFSALTGLTSLRGGRVDAVVAMSPPLTMGLTGWVTHLVRRGPLVFNIQDVFPDAAVQTGRDVHGDRHVEPGQQPNPGQQATENAARDIRRIVKTEGRRPDAPGERRQCRAHQHRRGKQTHRAREPPQTDSGHPVFSGGKVQVLHQRQAGQRRQATDSGARFQHRIDPQRIPLP